MALIFSLESDRPMNPMTVIGGPVNRDQCCDAYVETASGLCEMTPIDFSRQLWKNLLKF